jgi:subtilase family serine protease
MFLILMRLPCIIGSGGVINLDTVYLSDDTVLDVNDVVVGSYDNVTNLDANTGLYNSKQRISILAGTPGYNYPLTKYLIFRTNSSGIVAESDSTDNIVFVPITVSAIDLALSFPIVGNGGGGEVPRSGVSVDVTTGSTVNVRWYVDNLGNVNATTGYFDQIYVSQDAFLDAGDISLFKSSENAPILANDFTYNTTNVVIPTGISGNAYILFYTDSTNQQPESDKSNNLFAAPVFVVTDPPDLTVTAVTAPTDLNIGQSTTVSWTVQNQGTGSTRSNWSDSVYLSDDNVLDSKDTWLGYRYNSTPLTAGSSYSQNNLTFNLSSTAAGTKYLLFATDKSYSTDPGSLAESNETNNVFAQQINIKAPDLAPVSFVVSSTTGVLGSPLKVGWSVKNQGQAIAGNWVDAIVLSDDMVYDKNGTDKVIDTFYYPSNSLAVDGTYQIGLDANGLPTRQVTIPFNTQGGNKYLLFVTDIFNYSNESNENNNTTAFAINIPAPDLVVSQVTASTTNPVAAVGSSISVNWTVINQGAVSATNYWYDYFYLSDDQTFDSKDVYLGNIYRSNGDLAAGASYTKTNNLTLPNSTTTIGNKYIIAIADGGSFSYQGETDENNNAKATATPIEIAAPNLIIAAATAPAIGVLGDNASVTWTVKNNSSVPALANYWYDGVYLSSDQIWDASDALLSTDYIGPTVNTGANSQYTRTIDVNITGNKTGNQYLIFKADIYNYQTETDKTDNIFVLPINITTKDLQANSVVASAPAVEFGTPFNVTWNVSNVGVARSNGTWADEIFLSRDKVLSNDDISLIRQNKTANLATGDAYSTTASVVAKLFNPLPVDASGFVTEVEPNNSIDTALDIQQNFVLSSGNNYTAKVKGTVSSGADNGDWYRISASPGDVLKLNLTSSVNSLPSNGYQAYVLTDLYDRNGSPLYSYTLPSTAYAGEYYIYVNNRGTAYSGSYSLTVGIQTNTPFISSINQDGLYYLLAKTDATNLLPEGSETNNVISSETPVFISSPTARPDLTIVGNVSANALIGSTIPISWTVNNISTVYSAQSGWFDQVYLSDDNQLDSNDKLLKSKERDYTQPVVAAGASYQVNENISLPIDAFGAKYLLFVTDRNNNLLETNENNNISAVSLQINAPDLTIATTGTTPTTAILGDNINLAWRVTNSGTIATTADWVDSVYVSSSPIIDYTSRRLADFSPVSKTPLAIGGAYDFSQSVTVNDTSRLTGQQYLIIKTDATDSQIESNNGNNSTVIPITFTAPDLTVSAATSPSNIVLGQPIPLTWTVTNNSSVAAPTIWPDSVYVSDDQVLDGSDTLIGQYVYNRNTPLAGEDSYTNTQTVSIPNTQLGNRYLLFVTDYGSGLFGAYSNQGETNESNNIKAVPISLSAPDLLVSSITATAAQTTVVSGQPVELVWTIKNQGAAEANGTWTDNIYLSDDSNIGNDRFIGSFDFTGKVAAGQSIERRQTITLPIDIATSNYRFVVITDSGSRIPEGINNEANNTAIDDQPIQISKFNSFPNLVVTGVTPPATAVSGQSVVVSWQVTNSGQGATSSPNWYDRIWLSQDDTLDITADYLLNSVVNPTYLEPGKSYTNSATLQLPQGVESIGSQSWRILVDTDAGAVRIPYVVKVASLPPVEISNVDESDKENDNVTASAPFIIAPALLPDLQVTKVAVSPWTLDKI